MPLQPRDFDLLKGRRDIIRAIEAYTLNTGQRPALLLYGRRRMGKSSTLLNLPRLLSSQFEPVYIDCQDAKWRESDQAFCYNLACDIFDRLHQSEAVKGIRQPQETQFEKNAFTRLDEYLDQFEQLAAQRNKRLLLAFDEYEGLEESISAGDISKNVLGKLRNIIQHRERIVVLVSGSHRFEELKGVNWASYLINTRTLELSFLDETSARELLTEPVPQLHYEDSVLEEILRLTRCQPYLLQAVASELVNHLNDRQQTTATRADLEAAVEITLTSAGAYFANTWREDNSAAEQTVLRAFATGEGDSVLTAEYQTALQSLCRKEMLERNADGYCLAVPLFGRWIVKNQVTEAARKVRQPGRGLGVLLTQTLAGRGRGSARGEIF
ncbi:MAG: ATP-binding protein [Blastocatellia bacterium]